jgi:O-antigen ligase
MAGNRPNPYTISAALLALALCAKLVFTASIVIELRSLTVFFTLLATATLLYACKNTGQQILTKHWQILFCILCILQGFAVAFAEHLYPALSRQSEVFTYFAFIYVACLTLRQHPSFTATLFITLGTAFLINFISEASHWLKTDDWGSKPFSLKAYFHVRHFSHASAATFLLALPFALNKQHRYWHFSLALLFTSGIALLISGGRAAILTVIALSLLFFCKELFKKRLSVKPKQLLLFGAGFIVFLLCSHYISSLNSGMGTERLINSMQSFSSNGRFDIWRGTVEALSENLLFGLGPEGYIFIQPHLYGQTPHNFILQFISEWGIIAAAIAIVFIVWLCIKAVKLLLEDTPIFLQGCALAFLGFTAMALVSSTFYQPANMLYTSIFIAGLLSSAEQANTRQAAIHKTPVYLIIALCLIITTAAFSQQRILKKIKQPSTDSLLVNYALHFPFTAERYMRWLDYWAKNNPEAGLQHVEWGINHGEYIQWIYLGKKAFYQKELGQLEQAKHTLKLASDKAGPRKSQQLINIYQ